MPASRIGAYVLQHRYRVDPCHREQLIALFADIRAYALDLGVASFEVWQDDSDPWLVTELHGYDSWSHYRRLTQKPLPAAMEHVYADLERRIEGGVAGIETRTWNPLDVSGAD
jgi:hypothetical protein